jgi:hypothetical protein
LSSCDDPSFISQIYNVTHPRIQTNLYGLIIRAGDETGSVESNCTHQIHVSIKYTHIFARVHVPQTNRPIARSRYK